MINTKCCCGDCTGVGIREIHLFGSFDGRWLFGSDGCNECASTSFPDGVTRPNTQTGWAVAPGRNGPLSKTRQIFCAPTSAMARPFACISSVGTNRLGSADGSSVRLSTEISDHDFAGFGDGNFSRQHVTVKPRGVRVIVSVVAPGDLRMHLEQPGLWIDTIFGFIPAPSGRRAAAILPGPESKTQVTCVPLKVAVEVRTSARFTFPETELGRTRRHAPPASGVECRFAVSSA